MASLPESDQARFWNKQFLPLAAEEHARREQVWVLGQGEASNHAIAH